MRRFADTASVSLLVGEVCSKNRFLGLGGIGLGIDRGSLGARHGGVVSHGAELATEWLRRLTYVLFA